MFASLLVANRGEIACRIFRTARRMGLRCLAVHSEADVAAMHVRAADESVRIGPAPAAQSYLRADRILDAARAMGAEAIHPAYGFLSENPDFAEAVIAAGLVWVGPQPAAIRAMGLKDEAKRIAAAAGVPVLAGYAGEDQSEKRLAKAAKEIGFPVLIKAVAGGGGRGIREVRTGDQLKAELESARREAKAAFGDDRVLIEKLIERPRHIEVQVFGDAHGNRVHLFERDCSLQRRRQKVIEEAPAPGMSAETRAAMTQAALRLAQAVDYQNAGTVEFIVDGAGAPRPDGFWFLEMNTRLQVEHPVTEAITGLDLVEWQLRVAAGEVLPATQDQITLSGHAIEARICAEDPSEGFRPSAGTLSMFELANPRAERQDAGFATGDPVPSDYDSLLAKQISHAPDRAGAIAAAEGRLAESCVAGVATNIAFLARLLRLPAFAAGDVHTALIAEHLEALTEPTPSRRAAAAAMVIAHTRRRPPARNPWDEADGFRLNAAPRRRWALADAHGTILAELASVSRAPGAAVTRYDILIDGETVACEAFVLPEERPPLDRNRNHADLVLAFPPGPLRRVRLAWRGEVATVFVDGAAIALGPAGWLSDAAGEDAGDALLAPLPGRIAAVLAQPGEAVRRGQALVVLEAMKMEHQLKAPRDGAVGELFVAVGDQTPEGAVLLRLAPVAG